jgi:hypothetical protein
LFDPCIRYTLQELSKTFDTSTRTVTTMLRQVDPDTDAVAVRGFGFRRLDRLTVEHLLAAR